MKNMQFYVTTVILLYIKIYKKFLHIFTVKYSKKSKFISEACWSGVHCELM